MLKLTMAVSGGHGARITVQPAPDNTNGQPFVKMLMAGESHEFIVNGIEQVSLEELSREGVAIARANAGIDPDEPDDEDADADGDKDGEPEPDAIPPAARGRRAAPPPADA